MITIEEAFRKFRSRLELNDREQDNVSKRHIEMREHLRASFDVENDFLTGSYRRNTKTKPLQDVDFLCVLGDKERHRRTEPPVKLLDAFADSLRDKYGKNAVTRHDRSVEVNFGIVVDAEDNTDYRVVSMEAVPAFTLKDDYEIPDGRHGTWVKTNPKTHEEEALAAQKAYGGEWKGIVRMAKYWNNHNGKTIQPSFLLEVMALDCLDPPYSGNFPQEFQGLFATLADRISEDWPDPAGLGSPISQDMTPAMRTTAKATLIKANRAATDAMYLTRIGKNGEALEAWRALFGPKFPLS
jgi:Second Messenger Oligonucleotide or Dinucleotide Synthetase domain